MSRIITPDFYINKNRYREIELSTKTKVAGFFGGRAIKNGEVMREFGIRTENPNLLTDIGIDALSGASSNFVKMHLGTGTSPPTVTDGQLQNFGVNISSGYPSESGGNGGAPDYYGWRRLSWTSAIGGATGNWTEIGISSSDTNTAGSLRSRALILDSVGMPTSFPVLADEQFQGFYELRVYPSLTDDVRVVNVGGVPHNVTTRTAYAGSWVMPGVSGQNFNWFDTQRPHNGNLGSITGAPSGLISNSQYPYLSAAAYSNGNLYRDYSLTLSPSQWVTSFRGWYSNPSTSISHQHYFDPIIVKTDTESMIFNLRHSWARR